MNAKTALLFSLLVASLSACASAPLRMGGKKLSPASSDLKFSSFLKTDIDTVAEIHQQGGFSHLRTLMEKLYRRNPREWKKGGNTLWKVR